MQLEYDTKYDQAHKPSHVCSPHMTVYRHYQTEEQAEQFEHIHQCNSNLQNECIFALLTAHEPTSTKKNPRFKECRDNAHGFYL